MATTTDAPLLDLPEAAEPEAIGAAEDHAFVRPIAGVLKKCLVAVPAHPVRVADVGDGRYLGMLMSHRHGRNTLVLAARSERQPPD